MTAERYTLASMRKDRLGAPGICNAAPIQPKVLSAPRYAKKHKSGGRRRACTASPSRNPIAEARRFIDAHGETGDGQALRRVIDTLASGNRKFAESEMRLFSDKTLALVVA
jgi:hypothetical protein